MSLVRIVDLCVHAPVLCWQRLGLVLRESTDSGSREQFIDLPDLSLRFADETASAEGLSGWTLHADGDEHVDSIDGIATTWTRSAPVASVPSHRLGVLGVDHIVVMTGSLDRTSEAVSSALGAPLRRVRDAGHGVRQGFHRVGPIIIEIVERPDIDDSHSASLWGLVFTVADLDEAAGWLGPDVIGPVKEAVQPGRRIATVRSGAGLGVPLALMTPAV